MSKKNNHQLENKGSMALEAISKLLKNMNNSQVNSNSRLNINKYFLRNLSFWANNPQKIINSVLSLILIICILTITSPAAPQLVVGSINQLHQNFSVALSAGSLYEELVQNVNKYLSNEQTPQQETQQFRDSEVIRIENTFPDTVPVGEQVLLGAIPYDANDIPVSGVQFDWEIEEPNGKVQSNVSGLFAFDSLGQYKITVKGAGKEQTSIISVIERSVISNQTSSNSKDNENQSMLLPFEDWNSTNIEYARNPRNQRGETPGKPKENSNYNIIAPILSVDGLAGLDLNLNLTYNSRVWTKMGSDIAYDMDKDSPAPGWSMGFGKVIYFVGGGFVHLGADGTKRFFEGSVKTETNLKVFQGRSTDGSFIKGGSLVSGIVTQNGVCYYGGSAGLQFPDGSSISYNDTSNSGCLQEGQPIVLTPAYVYDRHGNIIYIYYDTDQSTGKTISAIKDSLGRFYRFNYTLIDGRHYVTSITGPGLRDQNGVVTERTFVRFNYKDHTLAYNFSGLNPKVRDNNNSIKVLSSIYYPATNTGYWFGDTDSYSPYGMIRKVEEQKGMSFNSSSGTISAGQVTRRRIYSYPETTSAAISDIPEYSTVTETWEGMPDPNSPAVTQYVADWNASPRTTTIILPYQQGKTIEYSHNEPTTVKDGVTFKTEFYDGNNVLRSKDETNWDIGSFTFSAHNNLSTYSLTTLRPLSITHTEIENGAALTKKSIYDSYGPYNRVLEMHEVGYNGETLRKTKTQYIDINDGPVPDPNNLPRVINLPSITEVFDGVGNRIDYTEYKYDLFPLQLNYIDGCPCPTVTRAQGNLSSIIKYSKVTNSTLEGQNIDERYYDYKGNVIKYNPSTTGANQSYFTFTSATGFARPEIITQGNDSLPNSKISTTASYDYNTGLPLSATSANQQTMTFEYDLQSWRLKKTISPTNAYTINDFDDFNRVYTQTDYASNGQIVGKQNTKVNGLSYPYRQEFLSGTDGQGAEIYDVVEVLYDSLGRTKKTSNSFKSNESAHGIYWSEVFYDAAGRVEKTKSANGSEKFNYYDEVSRPGAASNSLGHTYRIKDATGRQKWYRTDSDGNIAEVVEPDPDGDGSVASNGLLTKYTYDTSGHLIRTEQGTQERKFKYDSLGRITHQKMAETKATLDDSGVFVGEGSGTWSNFYNYDQLSNITSSKDARGVTTYYSYYNPSLPQFSIDPLNRLFAVVYNTNGATDVLPSSSTSLTYQTTGNVSQLKSIITDLVSTVELGYDTLGRINEKNTLLYSRQLQPIKVNYVYDSLNRITDVIYPTQHGAGGARKTVHTDFDTVGRMNGLKVDNVNYASDFAFNNFNKITSVKIGPSGANQISEQYNYDPQSGNLQNQKIIKGSATLLDLSYQYQQCSCSTGGNGKIAGIVNNLDRNKDRAYDYDKLGRLKKVTGGINNTWSQAYSYDRFGNRYNVATSGFESLRSNEQAGKVKNEQDKILNDSLPAGVITKDTLLNNVESLVKNDDTQDVGQSPLSLYKESEQLDNKGSIENNGNSNVAKNEKVISKTGKVETTPENSIVTTIGTPFDFDGDGKADFSTWRRTAGSLAAGTWAVYNRQTGQNDTLQFGANGNQIAPGDYDGDGKTDKAVWNPDTSIWSIRYSSTGNTVTQQWGAKGDAIVPADYDGDGKTDIAVWRPSTGDWWIIRSSNSSYYSVTFGNQNFGDIPNVGDYDGDGKADITVWRPSSGDWYIFILQSSNGQVLQPHWGITGDVPAPADYDGDNKTDLAVWRPSDSVWYVLQSSNGQYLFVALGSQAAKDVLVPADYDGDHKADIAVWTPSTGTWTIRQSTTGTNITHQLGTKDDVAVPSAYIRRSSAPRGQSVEIPRDGYENLSFDPVSNRITTSGFQYDLAGNQTRIVKPDGSVQRFQYDAAGRMVKVKNDSYQTLVTYTYGLGKERLITQEGNENSTNFTYYAWENGSVISEYIESSGSAVWNKNYIYMGGALLATQDKTINGEIVQFEHPDQLGTRLVTNPTDGTHFEQSTLPFGTALESESTGSINRRFTSYDRSSSSGLDYATNRFYDSSQGRFTTVDPIKMSASSLLNPQTLNLYSYTANDPINRTDPSGLDWGIGFGYTSPTLGGAPPRGGTANSFWTGLGMFLNGFLGNLFGGGRDYRGAIVPSYHFTAGTITLFQPPPLPGAGTIQQVEAPLTWKSATDCGDGAVSAFSYIATAVSSDWDAAMKEINAMPDGAIGFRELFRPDEQQQSLLDQRKEKVEKRGFFDKLFGKDPLPVDPLGASSHQAGYSIDIGNAILKSARGQAIIEILAKYNFIRNRDDDEIHFTHRSWVNMSAEERTKVYGEAQAYWKSLGKPSTYDRDATRPKRMEDTDMSCTGVAVEKKPWYKFW